MNELARGEFREMSNLLVIAAGFALAAALVYVWALEHRRIRNGEWYEDPDSRYYQMKRRRPDGSYEYRDMTEEERFDDDEARAW